MMDDGDDNDNDYESDTFECTFEQLKSVNAC